MSKSPPIAEFSPPSVGPGSGRRSLSEPADDDGAVSERAARRAGT